MNYRGHLLSANVSMLFTELPYVDRFAAAERVGFTQVESWWPFESPAPTPAEVDVLVNAVTAAGVSLSALNFFGGDIPGGERGIASRPDRQDELAANIEAVVGIAERTGCRLFNLLYRQLYDRWSAGEQGQTAVSSVPAASDAVGATGGAVL